MYQKVMVPLDGSELAECVLPHVESIVKGCQAQSVTFVRAVVPISLSLSGDVDVQPTEKDRKRIEAEDFAVAEDYLKKVVGRLKYDGIKLQYKVIKGKAAESLADFAEKNKMDLIIIATHGRSGISRWAWGSVADRILRSACVPVLMVRAPGCVPGA
jgi:nucleotide-binding universal stress UspA family protein